jgi:hypothetical protein
MENTRCYRVNDIDVSNKAFVRYMKDLGTEKPGSGDDVIVDDEYEW